MFSIIDQHLYLASQQYVEQFRNGPFVTSRFQQRTSRGSRSASAASTTQEIPQDSFLSAVERLGGEGREGSEDRGTRRRAFGDGDGPIIATPMGAVRPWPREGGGGGGGGATVPVLLPESGAPDAPGPGYSPASDCTVRRGQGKVGSGGGRGGDGVGWRTCMPTRTTRPRRMGSAPGSRITSTKNGDDTTKTPEPPVRSERRPEPEKKDSTRTCLLQAGAAERKGNPRPFTDPVRVRSGVLRGIRRNSNTARLEDPPVEPRGEPGPAKKDATQPYLLGIIRNKADSHGTRKPAPAREPPKATPSRSSTPPPRPSLPAQALQPSSSRVAFPPTSSPRRTATTLLTNDLSNITSLTLLTENLRGLASFYTVIFGATLPSPITTTANTATLTFTPQLTVTLRTSRSARQTRAFGEDVIVGSSAVIPKRAMIGVRVRDVGAVWQRLQDLGVGQSVDDGAETLGGVRVVGARRSVCLVDMSGHCWEAWEEEPE